MIAQELMREVRRLELRSKRRVEGLFAGEWLSVFKGQGIEFAEVREYEPGDDVRSIDWNVTARTGVPFIKRHVEERQHTVLVAVDVSGSERFGTGPRDKSALATELAATLALAATQSNDRAGLLLFSDRVEHFLPPRKGRAHTLQMLHQMVGYVPEGTGTDLRVAMDFLGRVQNRRSTMFIVSDFLQPPDRPYTTALKLLSQRHEVVAVTVSDPREQSLPPAGLLALRDAESGRVRVVDTGSRSARRRHGAASREHRARVQDTLRRCGVEQIDVCTDRPFIRDLIAYCQGARPGARR